MKSLIVLLLASLAQHAVSSHLTAQVRGVEVDFRVEDKVVKGPDKVLIESEDNRAELEIRTDVLPRDPLAPVDARVIVLPGWATSNDGSVRVSITVKIKRRILHFENVALWDGMGGLTFVIDRAPFGDAIAWGLGNKDRQADGEAHALLLHPAHGDGYVMAHLADKGK